MKEILYKFGLPILDFLPKEFISAYYKKLFLSNVFTTSDVQLIVNKKLLEWNMQETIFIDKVESLKTQLLNAENDIEEQRRSLSKQNNQSEIIYNLEEKQFVVKKLEKWIKCFPNIQDDEIDQYIQYYKLDTLITYNLLKERKQETLGSPEKIVDKLNEYVIGQDNAKQVLSFSFYLHAIRIGYLRPIINRLTQQAEEVNESLLPNPNVLLIGPTGSGKSYIINSLCKIFNLPYLKIDCSSLTSAGYVGNDIDSYFRKFQEKFGELAEQGVIHFDEFDKMSEYNYGKDRGSVGGVELQQEFLTMVEGGTRILNKKFGESDASIDTSKMMFVFSGSFSGIEKVIYARLQDEDIKEKIEAKKKDRERVLSIWENLSDYSKNVGFKANEENNSEPPPYREIENLLREVEIERVKEFIYEADKRGILEDIHLNHNLDKAEILQKVTYDDVIKFGIIPELVGRVGLITVLDALNKDQIIQIMKNSRDSILKKYEYFFKIHADKLVITDDVYELIAEKVLHRELGARGLNSIILHLIQDFLFKAPNQHKETFVIDESYFQERFGKISENF